MSMAVEVGAPEGFTPEPLRSLPFPVLPPEENRSARCSYFDFRVVRRCGAFPVLRWETLRPACVPAPVPEDLPGRLGCYG